MGNIQVVPVIILIIYIGVMLSIGFFVNRLTIKTSTDYMLAGRRMGVLMIACSLSANNIGGGSTTGVAAKAFNGWGMSAAWYVLAAAVAMIPLSFFAPRIRKTMAVTIPEVVNRRFGNFAGVFTAVLNVLSLFCLTASQILASASVLSAITGVPLNAAVVVAGGIIIVYTTLGGMLADAIADILQFFIIFFGLLISVPMVIRGAGGWQAVSNMLPEVELDMFKIGIPTILGLIFNYFCTFLSGPEMVSRFSSAEDEKTAVKASVLSAVLMGLLAFMPTLIGLVALAENPGLDGGQGTTALMYAASMYAPPVITGLVAAAIVAATMSSADSNLLCASTILIKDIYQRFINPEVTDRRLITLTRGSNVFICLISMGIALFNINLITLNLFAFALRSAGPFAAYALGMVVPKATKNAGIVSIIIGSIAVVIWQIWGGNTGVLPIVFGCFWGVVSFFLVTKVESSMGKPPAPSAFGS
ncbi:MAG: sodium:solute symporter family protein [Lacrimispora sp.]|uniref:sodium:solute symporter family protein n=1 Tax=Lacrimispora sp. TaxID=2719234 RepID=UPI0039E4A722